MFFFQRDISTHVFDMWDYRSMMETDLQEPVGLQWDNLLQNISDGSTDEN